MPELEEQKIAENFRDQQRAIDMMIPLPKAKAMAPKKKLKKLNKVIGFDQHQGQQPPFNLSSI